MEGYEDGVVFLEDGFALFGIVFVFFILGWM